MNYVEECAETETARELLRLETEWATAIQKQDQETLAKLLGDSFTSAAAYQPSEAVNKFDYIAEATRATSPRCEVGNFSIRQSGNLAVVKEELRFGSAIMAKPACRNLMVTDLWLRDGKGWKAMARLISSEAIQ